MKVTLNETEIAYCYQVASLRRMMNRSFGVKDETVKADFMDGEVLGVLGEFAFAKSCNVFQRLIDSVKGGGEDCIFKGNKIDVKATRNASKGIFVHKKNNDIDIYALAEVNLPVIELKGWIPASVVIDEKYKNERGQYVYNGQLNNHRIEQK